MPFEEFDGEHLGPYVHLVSYPSKDEAEWATASLRASGIGASVIADRILVTTGADVWVPEDQLSDAAGILDELIEEDVPAGEDTAEDVEERRAHRPLLRVVAVLLVLVTGGAGAIGLTFTLIYLGLSAFLTGAVAAVLTLMLVLAVVLSAVHLLRRR